MNQPTLEWLLSCSMQSLGELELACLNRSQQALKQAKLEMEHAVGQRELAGVTRWLIENREELLAEARRTIEGQAAIPFPARRTA